MDSKANQKAKDSIDASEAQRKLADFQHRLDAVLQRPGVAERRGQHLARPRLVAVSKTKPVAMIEAFFEAGQRLFGENRVQELQEKQPVLPDAIKWHAIGHLQRNKVKYIAPYVALIHAVDSERLLAEVHKQGEKIGRRIPVLLQVHIADEQSKYGWSPDELLPWLESGAWKAYPSAELHGLMGMATFTENKEQVRSEFRTLRALFEACRSGPLSDLAVEHTMEDSMADADAEAAIASRPFRELSMGMSGDWEIAVEEGATMVRIGSSLFGARD
jgi:pyridoxal phosphate enzyme (YggS family)